MSTPATRRAGFTLVELLIALVVTGLVIAAAQAAAGFAADALARARAERAAGLSAATRRATLAAWLSAADLVPGTGAFAVRQTAGGDFPRWELSFTVRDAGVLFPGPHRIRLWVDMEAATPQTGLVAELTALGGVPGPRPDTIELASGALGMSVRLQAHALPAPVWVTFWDSEDELPAGAELQLMGAAGGVLPALLALPLRVPIAMGQR